MDVTSVPPRLARSLMARSLMARSWMARSWMARSWMARSWMAYALMGRSLVGASLLVCAALIALVGPVRPATAADTPETAAPGGVSGEAGPPPAASDEGDAPVVGEGRPTWLEALDVLTKSVRASLSDGQPARGKALAMVAHSQANGNERLAGAAEFAAALAELARGDAAAFGRHIDKALGPLDTDAAAARTVVAAAKTRAKLGDYKGAKALLDAWGTRLGDAGLTAEATLMGETAEAIKPPPPPPPPPEALGPDGKPLRPEAKKRPGDVVYPIIVD